MNWNNNNNFRNRERTPPPAAAAPGNNENDSSSWNNRSLNSAAIPTAPPLPIVNIMELRDGKRIDTTPKKSQFSRQPVMSGHRTYSHNRSSTLPDAANQSILKTPPIGNNNLPPYILRQSPPTESQRQSPLIEFSTNPSPIQNYPAVSSSNRHGGNNNNNGGGGGGGGDGQLIPQHLLMGDNTEDTDYPFGQSFRALADETPVSGLYNPQHQQQVNSEIPGRPLTRSRMRNQTIGTTSTPITRRQFSRLSSNEPASTPRQPVPGRIPSSSSGRPRLRATGSSLAKPSSVSSNISSATSSTSVSFVSMAGTKIDSIYESILVRISGFRMRDKWEAWVSVPIITFCRFLLVRPVVLFFKAVKSAPSFRAFALVVICLVVGPWLVSRSFIPRLLYPIQNDITGQLHGPTYDRVDDSRPSLVSNRVDRLENQVEQVLLGLGSRMEYLETIMGILAQASATISNVDYAKVDVAEYWKSVFSSISQQINQSSDSVQSLKLELSQLIGKQVDNERNWEVYSEKLGVIEQHVADISHTIDSKLATSTDGSSSNNLSIDYELVSRKVMERLLNTMGNSDEFVGDAVPMEFWRNVKSSMGERTDESSIISIVQRELSGVVENMRDLENRLKASIPQEAAANLTFVDPHHLENVIIQQLVEQTINKYETEHSAKPDYALRSVGAKIVRYGGLTSKIYVHQHESKNNDGKGISASSIVRQAFNFIWPSDERMGVPTYVNPPEVVLDSQMLQPGKCWCFSGSRGYLTVLLSRPVNPSEIVIDHIPTSQWPADQKAAPKDFEVWAVSLPQLYRTAVRDSYSYHRIANDQDFLDYIHDSFAVTLADTFPDIKVPAQSAPRKQYSRKLVGGKYQMIADKNFESAQSWPVAQSGKGNTIDVVQFRFKTNWGDSDRTCVYRVGVRGQEEAV